MVNCRGGHMLGEEGSPTPLTSTKKFECIYMLKPVIYFACYPYDQKSDGGTRLAEQFAHVPRCLQILGVNWTL